MTETSSFHGKYAVITGGTQGLGEATARLFAARGAAGIIIVGRDEARGERVATDLNDAGCEAHFVGADLADANAARQPVAAALSHFGAVHVLVNAAAWTGRGSIWDTPVDDWDRMMAINVRAPFILTQDAARAMRERGLPGSIVNVASVVAHGGPPNLTAYSTSKGALVTLTRNVAYAVMRHRIRVNAINLGWMDTPGEDAIQRAYHDADDNWLAAAEAEQPFGRLIKVGEAARAIAFLASDEAGLLTGTVMEYDQSVVGGGNAPKPPAGS